MADDAFAPVGTTSLAEADGLVAGLPLSARARLALRDRIAAALEAAWNGGLRDAVSLAEVVALKMKKRKR